MTDIVSEPKSFLEHVAAIHVDRLLCPAADELMADAAGALRYAWRRRDPSGNTIWLSRGEVTKRIKEVKVAFTLYTARTGFKRKNMEINAIYLIANGDFANPAALILSAPDIEGASASLVVNGVVNDPGHIAEITPIVEAIQRSSYPPMDY